MRLLIDFLKKLTPSWMGWGPGLVLYALLASAVGLTFALDWAAKNMAESGPMFARLVGLNCLAFIALSAWVAVRKHGFGAGAIKRLYVWAESVPLAVALIVSIAYASVAGSVYSAVEPAYGKAYIFHSGWYLGLIAGLAANLILCSWESSWRVFQLPGKFDPRGNPSFFENARQGDAVAFAGTREQAESAFQEVYPRARFDGQGSGYVQKGVFSRFGPTVVHIGLLAAMAAGGYRILSERIGLRFINAVPEGQSIPSSRIRWMGLFDSQIQISEGETKRDIMVKKDRMTPFSGSNSRQVQLDFAVKCHNFEAAMYPGTQTPSYFGSLLEITDLRTGEKKIATVDMNTAVSFNGYKFSQNSYSAMDQREAPRGLIQVAEARTGTIHEFDAGPGTRNKLAPKGELTRYQLEVDELAPGAPWILFDMEAPDAGALGKVIAQGNLLEGGSGSGGEGGMVVEPIALYRNFQIDGDEPKDASDQWLNPALLLRVKLENGETAYTYIFPNTGFLFGAPEGLEFKLVDTRAAMPQDAVHGAAKKFEKTGDAPTLARPDAPADSTEENSADAEASAPAASAEEEFSDPLAARRAAQLETQRSVTERFEYRVAVIDAATGRTLGEDWTSLGHPMRVGGAVMGGVSEAEWKAAIDAANANGQRFVARLAGPAQGYRTILGVIRDPSLPYLYAGCIIVILGVLQCFAMTYREAWMLYRPGAGPSGAALVHLTMKKQGSSDKPFEEIARIKRRLLEIGGAPELTSSSASEKPAIAAENGAAPRSEKKKKIAEAKAPVSASQKTNAPEAPQKVGKKKSGASKKAGASKGTEASSGKERKNEAHQARSKRKTENR
jgi:cytochrome c biogenesis protein ResB